MARESLATLSSDRLCQSLNAVNIEMQVLRNLAETSIAVDLKHLWEERLAITKELRGRHGRSLGLKQASHQKPRLMG